jgi:signal transduction histidine kinase
MTAERILIVDDEPQIVRLCVQILSELGYVAFGSEDGHAALASLEQEPADLLLVDIKMPDIDGLSLLRQARDLDPNLAAVVMTGYATMDRAIEALRSGARGFVLKPFGMQDLSLAVEEALARRRLEQERLRLEAQLPVLEISQALMSEGDPVSLAEQILKVVARQTRARAALIALAEDGEKGLKIVASRGCEGQAPGAGVSADDGLSRRALAREDPLLVEGSELAGVDLPWRALLPGGGAVGLVLVPMRSGNKDVGVLGICPEASGRARGLTPTDLNLLSILGRQVAVALENARLYATEQQRTAELARALEKQQELDRLKDEFIRNVSHELRTPLALVLGYAELLADGMLDDPAPGQVEPLRVIVERCRDLSSLVETITAIIEYEDRRPRRTPISLAEVVESVLADYRLLAKRSGLRLEVQISPQVPAVLADRRRLRTVVENLLDNAVKFTPAGGSITVSLAGSTADEVLLCVADTGIGIAPRHHAQIFDRFFQVDGTLRRRYGGSGLGLALVKEIVEAHHGSVRVESDLRRGSAFTVRLPAVRPPEP